MDAEHRHELKQNDLEDFLANFREFWAKWGNSITIVVLVAVIAFTAYRLFTTRQQGAREKALSELATARSPAELIGLARDTSYPDVRVRAATRAADMLLLTAAMPKPEPEFDADGKPKAVTPLDPAQREKNLAEAAALYKQVLAEPTHPVWAINAHLGLASVLESQSKWDEAARAYEAVAKAAADRFPLKAKEAELRLAMLDRIQAPVTFAPEPEPTPEPAVEAPAASEPATQGDGSATATPETPATATPPPAAQQPTEQPTP